MIIIITIMMMMMMMIIIIIIIIFVMQTMSKALWPIRSIQGGRNDPPFFTVT